MASLIKRVLGDEWDPFMVFEKRKLFESCRTALDDRSVNELNSEISGVGIEISRKNECDNNSVGIDDYCRESQPSSYIIRPFDTSFFSDKRNSYNKLA